MSICETQLEEGPKDSTSFEMAQEIISQELWTYSWKLMSCFDFWEQI